jgi:hypothetical protein
LEEEQEAEISIHQEALERSRGNASALGKSYLEDDDDDDDASRPMDDYGGGNDDHDDDDNDGYGFGTWGTPTMRGNGVVVMPPSALRGRRPFLDISPSSNPNSVNNHQTSAILDAMVSSQVFLDNTQSDYSYFDTQALMEKMQVIPNQWAGSAHWKKMDRLRRQPKHNKDNNSTKENTTPDDNEADDDDMNTATASTKKKKKKKTTSKAKKEPVLVNLAAPPTPAQLRQLYAKPPQKKEKTTRGKKRTTTPDPLQWSKAMIAKLEKMDNLLPKDVGVGLEQLTTLFLRPDVNLALLHHPTNNNDVNSHVEKPGFLKSVGMYFHTWDANLCVSKSSDLIQPLAILCDSIL